MDNFFNKDQQNLLPVVYNMVKKMPTLRVQWVISSSKEHLSKRFSVGYLERPLNNIHHNGKVV